MVRRTSAGRTTSLSALSADASISYGAVLSCLPGDRALGAKMRRVVQSLLAAVLLVAIAACGGTDPQAFDSESLTTPPTPTSESAPQARVAEPTVTASPAPPPTVTPIPAPATTPPPTSTAKVGKEVGDRLPDIEFQLTDGSTLTTVDLLARNRPAFLFFYAEY